MFETLMYLVHVHAHVSSVAKPLLERTLEALVEEIADEALRCFRKVKKFGMGGMLRVSTFLDGKYKAKCQEICYVIGNPGNRVSPSNCLSICYALGGEEAFRRV